jgi:hypothetical protein
METIKCLLCGHVSSADTVEEVVLASREHSAEVHPPGVPQSPLPPLVPPVPLA